MITSCLRCDKRRIWPCGALTWVPFRPHIHDMDNHFGRPSRRDFLRQGTALGAALALGGRAVLAQALEPDPEVPNEQIARLLKDLFGDRPIRRGHVALDMPLVAEDGRVVPVIIEADLPMTPTK